MERAEQALVRSFEAVTNLFRLAWAAFKLLAVRVVVCMALSVGLVLLGIRDGVPVVELVLVALVPWAFLIGIPAATARRLRGW